MRCVVCFFRVAGAFLMIININLYIYISYRFCMGEGAGDLAT